MKNLLLLSFVCIGFNASAQLSKGKIFLGGSINAFSQKTTSGNISTEGNSFNISPAIGTFYKENKLAGIMLGFSNAKNESNGNTDKIIGYSIGGFLRQYRPLKNNFFLFFDESLTYSFSKQTSTAGINQTRLNSNGLFLGFKPGIAYSVTPKLQLELSMNNLIYAGYRQDKTTGSASTTASKTNSFSVGSNLSLNPFQNFGLGVRLIL